MNYIGIDPGLSGAVAILYEDGGYDVWDIPTIMKGTGSVKYEIDAVALYSYIARQKHSTLAALERVNAMPGQSSPSVFSLGDSFGVCRASLAAALIPTTYVTPQSWKNYFKISKEKEEARALAVKLYPKSELHLKKHIDRAEALLIATYFKEKKNG
jgi:crossover junction endodeoxyribonuclease RuvC